MLKKIDLLENKVWTIFREFDFFWPEKKIVNWLASVRGPTFTIAQIGQYCFESPYVSVNQIHSTLFLALYVICVLI